MKRDRLAELVADAAAAAGYAFHTGEQHLIDSSVRLYPVAWLTPPEVRAHTGRHEGETTWRLTLHLMALPAGGALTETVWRGLERDALEMVASVAMSPEVCAVDNVRCTPAERSLTLHGETSLAISCDITMWYIS